MGCQRTVYVDARGIEAVQEQRWATVVVDGETTRGQRCRGHPHANGCHGPHIVVQWRSS